MLTSAFKGKTIAITGAGRGLGAAMAHVVAAAGATVVLCGRTPEALEATRWEIAARARVEPLAIPLDLADPMSVQRAAALLAERHPTLDVLINNGAFWLAGPLEQNEPGEIAQAVTSAVTGTLLFTRALLPLLRRSATPDIVNIVSMSGLVNTPLNGAAVAFYAAKHGQAGLTDGLREELRGTPIRVAGIYPPVIENVSPLDPAWDELPNRPKNARVTNRDVVESVAFALARPRNCTIASLVLDADAGGILG